QIGPLGVRTVGGPSGISGCPLLVREQVDQCVGIIEVLPNSKNGHSTLFEYLDFSFAKPLVQVIDAAFELTDAIPGRIHGVHPQFETTRILSRVFPKVAGYIRTAWRGRRRRAPLSTFLTAPLTTLSNLGALGALRGLRGLRRGASLCCLGALSSENPKAQGREDDTQHNSRKAETSSH